MPAAASFPFLTAALPGIGGALKELPEDFVVDELPVYRPSGSGEHLFLWVEKTDVSGPDLVRHIGRALGISPRDIGTAGVKDRRAVTRQFVSVPARAEGQLGGLRPTASASCRAPGTATSSARATCPATDSQFSSAAPTPTRPSGPDQSPRR